MENSQLSPDNDVQHTLPPQPEKKSSTSIIFICAVALISAVLSGTIGFFAGSMQKTNLPEVNNKPPETGTVACTLDAKLCPDGSAVGRTGPNCEFSPCPTGSSATVLPGWKKEGSTIISEEQCFSVHITNIGPLDDMSYYVAESYPNINPLEKSNYFVGKYKTIVIPSLGIGELEKIYVDVDKNVYEVAVYYIGKGEGTTPTKEERAICEQREKELPQVINGISF